MMKKGQTKTKSCSTERCTDCSIILVVDSVK